MPDTFPIPTAAPALRSDVQPPGADSSIPDPSKDCAPPPVPVQSPDQITTYPDSDIPPECTMLPVPTGMTTHSGCRVIRCL